MPIRTITTICKKGTPMLEPFLLRAAAAGLVIAAIAGPLGSVLVWRRMAYFGDALSHTALLGVAMGLALGASPTPAIIALCLFVALLLSVLERRGLLSSDTLLGLAAHGALSFGMIAISLLPAANIDLYAYLFGDILTVSGMQLIWMTAAAVIGLLLLAYYWNALVAITVHEDLAAVEGVPVTWVRTLYLLLIALTIALAMRVVGVLLVTALMIIPAAAARAWARSPESMAVGAAVMGMAAVLLGLGFSVGADTPTGPSIVAAACVLCVGSFVLWRQKVF
jgi:zinc transport system permease protein